MYLDFKMEPGATLHQSVPTGWTAFAYVLTGQANFGEDTPEEILYQSGAKLNLVVKILFLLCKLIFWKSYQSW